MAAFLPGLDDALTPAVLKEFEVGVWSAEQDDAVLQRVATRKHGEVLHHDGIGERAEDLARGDAGFDEVDDVGLGKDTTLRGDGMQLGVVPGHAADVTRIEAEFDEAFVDGGAGAGGAFVIHRGDGAFGAVFAAGFVDDDLRVLAAELDDAACFRMEAIHGHGDRIDLLHKLRTERLRERLRAGTGHEDARDARKGCGGYFELLHDFLRLLRLVALIVGPEDALRLRIDEHGFDRGGADIHTEDEV